MRLYRNVKPKHWVEYEKEAARPSAASSSCEPSGSLESDRTQTGAEEKWPHPISFRELKERPPCVRWTASPGFQALVPWGVEVGVPAPGAYVNI